MKPLKNMITPTVKAVPEKNLEQLMGDIANRLEELQEEYSKKRLPSIHILQRSFGDNLMADFYYLLDSVGIDLRRDLQYIHSFHRVIGPSLVWREYVAYTVLNEVVHGDNPWWVRAIQFKPHKSRQIHPSPPFIHPTDPDKDEPFGRAPITETELADWGYVTTYHRLIRDGYNDFRNVANTLRESRKTI